MGELTFSNKRTAVGYACSILKFSLAILSTAVINGCARQNQLPQPKIKKITSIRFIAWNEDTVNSYHIIAFSNNTFYYGITVTDTTGKESRKAYVGKIKYRKDSVFLKFKGSDHHIDLTPYLVVEASGKFLIQYFRTSNIRYFLRFQPPLRHHFNY